MPTDWSPTEIFNLVVLASGAVTFVICAGFLLKRRLWREFFDIDSRERLPGLLPAMNPAPSSEAAEALDPDARVGWWSRRPLPILPFTPLEAMIPPAWYVVIGGVLAMYLMGPQTTSSAPASAATQAATQAAATQPVAGDPRLTFWVSLLTIPVLVIVVMGCMRRDVKRWGWRPKRIGFDLLLAGAAYLASFPLLSALHALMRELVPAPQHETLQWLTGDHPIGQVAMVILAAAVVVPVLEELYFRGILQNTLSNMFGSQRIGIGVTSVLFGLVHWSVLDTVVPLAVFGAVLGFLYVRSRSIMAPILLHVIFNSATLIAATLPSS